MKKISKIIAIFIFIFLIIILLTISIVIAANSNTKEINKEKIFYEIKYIDTQLTYIVKMFNSTDTSNNPPWNELINNVEELYIYWNSTILDLNNLKIDKQNLTDFGKRLDDLMLSINIQTKKESLNNLLELYKLLIIYSENLNYNENYEYKLYSKYYLLKAYSIVETENWTLIYEYILESTNYLYNIVNSMENNKYNQYNINQAYISMKELENIIDIKNSDIFYLKFRISIEKLENI